MMSKNNHCLEGNKEIFTKSLFSQLSDNIRENICLKYFENFNFTLTYSVYN